ncbi:MAG: MFS transporter [Anaerolinea sp.]|nr:MFS transporter [Anaerolinea sp.]
MTVAKPSLSLLDVEHRSLTIGLVLAVTLVAFEALAVATIMPEARDDLGGLRFYAWAFSGFLLASLVSITWAGAECDRRGPARPITVALVLFGAGLAIAGAAPAMPVLVAGRIVQGLGAGALTSVAYVAIGRGYDEALRPRMFAVLSSAWVIPGLAGPVVAATVAELVGWRMVFAGLLPLLVVAAVLVMPALSRMGPPAVPSAQPQRLSRALRLTAGAGLVLAGVSAPSVLLAAVFVPAGLFLAVPAFVLLIPPGTFAARRGTPAAVAGMGLINLAFFGTEAFIPLMLTSVRETSTLFVGIVLTGTTLSWTSGSWVTERLSRRGHRHALAMPGALIVALGIAGVAVVVAPGVPVALAAVAWTVGGLGMGMAYPTFSLTVLGNATEGAEGAAASSMKLAEVLGPAVGIGLGGALIAAGESAGNEGSATALVFAVMAVVALVCAFVSTRLVVARAHGRPADAALIPLAEQQP